MSGAPTVAVVAPVTAATTAEAILASVLVPQFNAYGPAIYQGTTFRITCLCSFSVGGTPGTITARARIGGLAGQSLGAAVSGTLTAAATGACILNGYATLLTGTVGAASNWSGGIEISGNDTTATDVVNAAGVATPTLTIAQPQLLVVTVQLSSATSSLTMNSGFAEQVV